MPKKIVVKCPKYIRRYQGKGYASIKCCQNFNIGFSNTNESVINKNTLNCEHCSGNVVLERNTFMEKYCCNDDYNQCQYFNN